MINEAKEREAFEAWWNAEYPTVQHAAYRLKQRILHLRDTNELPAWLARARVAAEDKEHTP